MRSNQIEKNVDSGGFVGVVISSTTTRPPGLHHARHLGQPALEVGEVARAEADGGGVEAVVGIRELERVAPLPASAPAPSCARARACPRRSRSRSTSPPGATRRASSTARSPVPVATSSARSPGRSRARSAARSRQRWCRPGRHDRVHEVVEARDAIEHRADLTLLEGARRGGGGAHALLVFVVQLREEVDQRGLLLLGQARVRGHRRGRVLERAPDRRLRQSVADRRSGAALDRRCRSRRSCGRPGSPTGRPPASRPRTSWRPSCRSRSASRRWRRGRSGSPSRRS